MAEEKKRDEKKDKPQGPGISVFASVPEGGKAIEIKGEGKCDVSIVFAHSFGDPRFATPANVVINGIPVGHVRVGKDQVRKTYHNLELDLTKPIKVEVLQIGSEKVFTLVLPAPTPSKESKDAKDKPTDKSVPAAPKRFEVIVHPLTPSKENPVTFVCKDATGKPEKGSVHINAGQRFKVKGYERIFQNDHGFQTADNGRCSLYIKLLECDALVTFLHEESGEMVQKTLLKEE